MPFLKPSEFYAQGKARQWHPVYLFAGEESFLQEEALAYLGKALNSGGSLNNEVFFGPDLQAHELILAAQTLPLMAERRFLVVKDSHKLKKAEADRLGEYFRTPSSTSCVIMLWPEKIGRQERSSALFAAVEGSGALVEFKALYERELPAWVVQKTKLSGKKITDEAAQYLVSECGSNLLDLHNEIDKLVLFAGGADEITLKDAETVSGHTKMASLNQLAEAVEGRKLADAIAAVENLLEEGEVPLKILAAVYRSVRRLLAAKSLAEERRMSPQEIKQELRLHPYFDRFFFANLSRFGMDELRKGLEMVMRADVELKSSSRPENQVFEELLLGLAGGRVNQLR